MTATTHPGATAPVGTAQRARPHHPPVAAVVLGLPLVLAALVAVVLLAFGLPAVKAAPHDLPIGVAGPAGATGPLRAGLEQGEPGAFAVTSYADEAALTEAIRDRDVYGGIAVGPDGPTVLTASAASPAVAQALTQLGTGLARQQGVTATVRDVVPLPAADPRGAGLATALLPLVIGAVAPAVALGRLAGSRRVQLAALAVYSAVAGTTFAAVLHHVLGTLPGGYLAESAVLAATIAAAALALLGLQHVLGRLGLALGALALVLVANPLSGATTAPELLASPWREIGQGMPPGAGSQLLRSVAFFDGAGGAGAWWVLVAWAVAGLLLLAVPRRARVTQS
jgi:hypothetical protein